MCACVSVCEYMLVNARALGGKKRMSDLAVTGCCELPAVTSGSHTRAVPVLNH